MKRMNNNVKGMKKVGLKSVLSTKKSLIIGGAVLATLGLAGTSFAWFTDTEAVTNVFSMGKVDIKIDEEEYRKNCAVEGYYNKPLVPGAYINKDLSIELEESSQEAYIRINNPKMLLLDAEGDPIVGEGVDGVPAFVQLISQGSSVFSAEPEVDWILIGDYYYYTKPVKQNQKVYFLKEKSSDQYGLYTLRIPESWGNNYANKFFSLDYTVEAIQSDNVTVDFEDANPWPNTEIYKFETKI